MRLAIALVMIATSALAADEKRVIYDEMPMLARFDIDRSLSIRFIDPSAMLREIGVEPGEALIEGRWIGAVFEGNAFLFAKGCKPIPYPVRGVVDLNGVLMVLGPTPVLNGCEPTGQTQWTASSIMRIEPGDKSGSKSGSVDKRPAQPKPKKEAKPQPKPKPKPRPRPVTPPAPQPYWYAPQQQRWF